MLRTCKTRMSKANAPAILRLRQASTTQLTLRYQVRLCKSSPNGYSREMFTPCLQIADSAASPLVSATKASSPLFAACSSFSSLSSSSSSSSSRTFNRRTQNLIAAATESQARLGEALRLSGSSSRCVFNQKSKHSGQHVVNISIFSSSSSSSREPPSVPAALPVFSMDVATPSLVIPAQHFPHGASSSHLALQAPPLPQAMQLVAGPAPALNHLPMTEAANANAERVCALLSQSAAASVDIDIEFQDAERNERECDEDAGGNIDDACDEPEEPVQHDSDESDSDSESESGQGHGQALHLSALRSLFNDRDLEKSMRRFTNHVGRLCARLKHAESSVDGDDSDTRALRGNLPAVVALAICVWTTTNNISHASVSHILPFISGMLSVVGVAFPITMQTLLEFFPCSEEWNNLRSYILCPSCAKSYTDEEACQKNDYRCSWIARPNATKKSRGPCGAQLMTKAPGSNKYTAKASQQFFFPGS